MDDSGVAKEELRSRLGVSKIFFYNNIKEIPVNMDTYEMIKRKKREGKIGPIQRQSVIDFSYSDEASYIDYNSRKLVTIKGADHIVRV